MYVSKKMTPQSDMNDIAENRAHGNERLYAQKEQVYYCFDYAIAIIIVAYFLLFSSPAFAISTKLISLRINSIW